MTGVNREIVWKYVMLFESFREYWATNFTNFNENRIGNFDFELGARIRYGLLCASRGQRIPDDCKYEKLLAEVDGWINYREST